MGKEKNKKTLLAKPIIDEVGKRLPDKDYKPDKPKVDWRARFYACTFCGIELPEVTKRERHESWWPLKGNPKISKLLVSWSWPIRALKCLNCGARQLRKGCPACKHDIWFNKETKIYKHDRNGCGFSGKKLER